MEAEEQRRQMSQPEEEGENEASLSLPCGRQKAAGRFKRARGLKALASDKWEGCKIQSIVQIQRHRLLALEYLKLFDEKVFRHMVDADHF